MAEVLITLAVVGIVAGITIPSIVAGNQKTELEARFAKAYRTIMYTVNMSVAQNGSFETWDWKSTWSNNDKDEFVKKYFVPYLNVVKFCPSDNSVKGCFPNTKYKWVGEGLHSDEGVVNPNDINQPKILLADGTSLMIWHLNNCYADDSVDTGGDIGRCLDVYIDINGFKKPNIRSLDFHMFSFYPVTSEFLPYGINRWHSYDKTTNNYKKNTKEEIYAACGEGSRGDACGARIVIDGFKINY